MPLTPSGQQFQIVHAEQRATIVEVGGGIREYFAGDRPVLHPYPQDAVCDGAHGTPLIPWPNRLADGRYTFDGVERRVALTEPDKGNAIHGLLRWRNWNAVGASENRVVMGIRLHPSDTWPFALDVEVDYSLDPNGLTVETRATSSHCETAASSTVDECGLELRAGTRILTDPDRQLPTGTEPVLGTAFDFRQPKPIGSLQMDSAFIDLERDDDGLAWIRCSCSDDRTVALWADAAYSVLQLYTADTLAPARRRRGLAAEPMTAPANGLQSGQGIVRLEPSQSHTARWGVGLS